LHTAIRIACTYRAELAEVVIPGNNLLRLGPRLAHATGADPRFDRQTRLFGDRGQQTFAQMRVGLGGVGGVGGVGSVKAELLARLGVGHLVLIGADHVAPTNLPRLLAAEPDDADPPQAKTALAERNARRANPAITLTSIAEQVQNPKSRAALETCDWIFLAADSHAARHWVNAIVHQHLIPATQAGVKIPISPDGDIGQIHAVTRFLVPGTTCLWCDG
jgi:tRNA A37 threonylcarbamoyladenosine dehydratase